MPAGDAPTDLTPEDVRLTVRGFLELPWRLQDEALEAALWAAGLSGGAGRGGDARFTRTFTRLRAAGAAYRLRDAVALRTARLRFHTEAKAEAEAEAGEPVRSLARPRFAGVLPTQAGQCGDALAAEVARVNTDTDADADEPLRRMGEDLADVGEHLAHATRALFALFPNLNVDGDPGVAPAAVELRSRLGEITAAVEDLQRRAEGGSRGR